MELFQVESEVKSEVYNPSEELRGSQPLAIILN